MNVTISARKRVKTTYPLTQNTVLTMLSLNTTDISAAKNKINSFHENGLEKGMKFCLTKYGCVLEYQTDIA